VMEDANDSPLDIFEIVGICLALGLAAFLTRYAATEMGLAQRIDAL
jgi:hypothetical protein